LAYSLDGRFAVPLSGVRQVRAPVVSVAQGHAGKAKMVRVFSMAFCALLFWAGCNREPIPDPHIQAVFAARYSAQTNSIKWTTGRKQVPIFNGQHYARSLMKIDASQCPKDFQIAWLDYVQKWQRQANDPGAVGIITALISIEYLNVKGAVWGLEKASEDTKKAQLATSDAWLTVEKQAIIFNCRIPTNAPGYRLNW